MLAQYARQEEEWVPCSDWGRGMKAYLDEVKRSAVVIVRGPKHKGRRVLEDRATREERHCSFCSKTLKSHNKSGACRECHDKTRRRGVPKATCELCPRKLNRTVKGGARTATVCYYCTRKGLAKRPKPQVSAEEMEQRRQERMRKSREKYQRRVPIRLCHCGRQLQANNKSGLCIEHNGMAGQASYRARRKKAA